MASSLNLVVLRCSSLCESAAFFTALGLNFDEHRHGRGEPHLAHESEAITFELYEAREGAPASTGVRLGFRVQNVDGTLEALGGRAKVRRAPHDSPWGRRAVLDGPDGVRVEITSADCPAQE